MTDRLSLYNGALRELGNPRLASLADNIAARFLLDSIWNGGVIDRCLAAGEWYFASRSVKLMPNEMAPDHGYQYAFDVPEDHIRTCGVWVDEGHTTPLIQYDRERDFLLSDADSMYMRYVSSAPEYGLAYGLWLPEFVAYVEVVMADEAAPTLLGDKTRAEALTARRTALLSVAQNASRRELPSQALPPGRWVSARYGRSAGDRGNTGRLIG